MPEHKDHKDEHVKAEKKDEIKVKKSSLKMAGFVIVFLVVGFAVGFAAAGLSNSSAGGSSNEVGQKVVKYLNENLVQKGTSASLVSVSQENMLYKITTSYQGQEIPVYATKDGIFLSSPLPINETTNNTNSKPETPKEIPKTAKPNVELFVMSFCPYGVQAETLMKPVVDLLGNSTNIRVRFITNINGNTTSSVQSLHGTNEANEDLRQECIMKYYSDKYWSYVTAFNAQCGSKLQDTAGLDACWKNVSSSLGFDTAKIDTCSKGQEGLDLLKADEQISNAYGVIGSPTLIINGVQYSGSRASDAFKSGICSAFTSAPSACGTTVNSTTNATPSGGCAA